MSVDVSPVEQAAAPPVDGQPSEQSALDLVEVDGKMLPRAFAVTLARCRPSRPADGCDGRGFTLRPNGRGGYEPKMCGCIVLGWRKFRAQKLREAAESGTPRQPSEADVQLRAAQLEQQDRIRARIVEQARPRLDRLRAELQEEQESLAAIAQQVDAAAAPIEGELAAAEAAALDALADSDGAREEHERLEEEIADLARRLEEKRRQLATASSTADERAGATTVAAARAQQLRAAAADVRAQLEARQRRPRHDVEKLQRRITRHLADFPELAAEDPRASGQV